MRLGRKALLAFLVLGLMGTVSAAGLLQDSFEDGDYTNNPAWSDKTTAGGTASVVSSNAYDGSYSLRMSSDGQGDSEHRIITHTLPNGEIQDGETYWIYMRAGSTSNLQRILFTGNNGYLQMGFANDGTIWINTDVNFYGTSANYNSLQYYNFTFTADKTNGQADIDIKELDGTSIYTNKVDVTYAPLDTVELSYRDDTSSSNNGWFDLAPYEYKLNSPPSIDSTAHFPDPTAKGDTVSYHANATDPDGDSMTAYYDIDFWKNGSDVTEGKFTETSTGNFEVNDVVTADFEDDGLNNTIKVSDGSTNTTATENFFIETTGPGTNIIDPVDGSDQFTYEPAYKFRIQDDGDDIENEHITCDVWNDTHEFRTVSAFENDTQADRTFSGNLLADKGSHTFKTECKDGTTTNTTASYEVKRFRIESNSTTSPVYETENATFDIEVQIGDMVNSLTTDLFWNGTSRATKDATGYSSHQNVSRTQSLHIPVQQSNATSYDWRFQVEVNYDDFQSSTNTTEKRNSTAGSQEVWYNFYDPAISNSKSQVIEQEDFTGNLNYVDVLDHDVATVEGEVTFNGTTKTGFSPTFDPPLLSTNTETKTATGKINISYNGDSRQMTASTDSIDIYKKILTDCSNPVNGVTGGKALTMTLYNEENRSKKLTGDIDFNFDVTHHGEHTRNYAFQNTGTDTADLCMYPTWAEYNITGPIQYSSDKDQNSLSKTFKDRQYNIVGELIDTANVEQLDLYLLSDEFATPVYFEVTDQGGDGVPGAKVKIQRYFIGTNSYLTVAKSETDSQGVATTYLRVNEIYYKYTVTKDGEVLLATDKEILTCQSSPCTKELRVNPEEDNPYFTEREGFEYSTDKLYDDDGNLTGFQATVSHDSDLMKKSQLIVERSQTVGTATECNVTATSNPSTLVCQFSEPPGGDRLSYSLTAETDGNSYTLDTGIITEASNIFQENAYFAAAMIFLSFSMLGLASPKLGISFSTAGILVPWYLGFYALSVAAVGSLVFVAIILQVVGRS